IAKGHLGAEFLADVRGEFIEFMEKDLLATARGSVSKDARGEQIACLKRLLRLRLLSVDLKTYRGGVTLAVQLAGVVEYHMALALPPSEQLKDIRNRLGITTRDVAEFSQKIAQAEDNPEYHISNAWLTQIENSDSVPSIFKLYSLSSIYRIKFSDILLLYGVDLQNLTKHQMAAPLPNTHLTNLEVYDQQRTVSFPIRFDRSFDVDNTNLLSRLVEVWGEVPIALIQHLDIRHGLYGYIGLQDMTLYPLLRPGSFVQIDPRVRKVQPMRWRTEFDRPIYFVELRDGYACSWCELQDGYLLLLPHPLSPRAVRRLAHRQDAEIVGQVTAVAMTLAPPLPPAPDAASRLPGQV